MEDFTILRKIIRESLEQSFMGKEINVNASATLISEKVEAADKKEKIKVLIEEKQRLLEHLEIGRNLD